MIRILAIFFLLLQYAQAQNAPKKTFDEVIAENKGKIILIDYWASWCKPCRKEMAEVRALMKKYKDADIAFVFISMDIDAEKWIKAAKKEGIADMPHSYMTGGLTKTEISRSIKVSSIPHYAIFDKNGKLVNADAMRPSEKQMESELEKYLAM